MPATIDVPLSALYIAVGQFLIATLGITAAQIAQGYPNRVPMLPNTPASSAAFYLTHRGLRRLNTNIDTWVPGMAPTTTQQETHYQVAMQIDCYGPTSGDTAAILTTLLRDDVGCSGMDPNVCQPLYSDDPIRAPLEDAETQYEDRWIVTAQLQYNPTVSTSQDFANTLAIDLVNVFEAYPP